MRRVALLIGYVLSLTPAASHAAWVEVGGYLQIPRLRITTADGLSSVPGANQTLILKGTRSAGDAGADVVVTGSVDRTAGDIFVVEDNGSARLTVGALGTVSISGGNGDIIATQLARTTANSSLVLKGNRSAADGDTDVIVQADADRTAGNVFAIKDNNASPVTLAKVDFAGKGSFNGGVDVNTTASQPTCDATVRGTLWVIEGATLVADKLQVCKKDAIDVYAWADLF